MGMLDEVMRGLSPDLIDLFVSNESVITRRTTVYNEITDAETVTDTTAELKVSPPFPYDTYTIDDKTILSGDLRTLVPAQTLDELGFSLEISSNEEAKLFLTLGGVTYSVMGTKRYASGDQVALYEIHLRG